MQRMRLQRQFVGRVGNVPFAGIGGWFSASSVSIRNHELRMGMDKRNILTSSVNAAGTIQWLSSDQPQIEDAVKEVLASIKGSSFSEPDVAIAFISPRYRWKQKKVETSEENKSRVSKSRSGRRRRNRNQSQREGEKEVTEQQTRGLELAEECPLEKVNSLLPEELKRKLIGSYAAKERGKPWRNGNNEKEPHVSFILARLPPGYEVQTYSIVKDALPELKDMEALVLRKIPHFYTVSTGDWSIQHYLPTVRRLETVFPRGGKVLASSMERITKDLGEWDDWETDLGEHVKMMPTKFVISVAPEGANPENVTTMNLEDLLTGGDREVEEEEQEEEEENEGEEEGNEEDDNTPEAITIFASPTPENEESIQSKLRDIEEADIATPIPTAIMPAHTTSKSRRGEHRSKRTREARKEKDEAKPKKADFSEHPDDIIAKFEQKVEEANKKNEKDITDRFSRLSEISNRLLLDGTVVINGGAVGLVIYSSKDVPKNQIDDTEALSFLSELTKYSLGNIQRRLFNCNQLLAKHLFFPKDLASTFEIPTELPAASKEVLPPPEGEGIGSETPKPDITLTPSVTPSSLNLPKRVPLFWLPKISFPGNELKLNIFEERYRLLMKECFDNNRPFGLVSGKEDSKDGVGTLLYVTAFDELHEDGSSLVSLKAGYRFSMQDIHVEPNAFGLYTAEVNEIIQDTPVSNQEEAEELGSKALQLFKRFLNARGDRYSTLSGLILEGIEFAEGGRTSKREAARGEDGDDAFKELLEKLPPPSDAKRLSFSLADEIPLSPEEKYKWLACTNTQERLRLQVEALRYLIGRR